MAPPLTSLKRCVDTVSGGQVSGWAVDPTALHHALGVEIL
jgi:hypothetical protein